MDLLLDGMKRVTVQEEKLKKEKEEIAKRERELKQKEMLLQVDRFVNFVFSR